MVKNDRFIFIAYSNEFVENMSAVHTVLVGTYHFRGSYQWHNMNTGETEIVPVSIKKVRKKNRGLS